MTLTFKGRPIDMAIENSYEQTFADFWQNILCDENGEIDLDSVKRELHDYYIVMQEATKVYHELTGGKISKPNTKAVHVIQLAYEHFAIYKD
ncbi:hypothetical protein I8748_27775 [Nostoc sp. CENA67]|uniref:Uncharacterized protein n=1 Tax=Amazonocrinis nigriterrae CENA67 TaxID=2794033 RepID=A0A8J7HYR2_9NOST|nr:hypothetical protein [Amazonocrinis nigriterrae]MBH8565922.1 hypothetical protein [Amazonocrinis nigriterrae CENA67]